MCLWHLYVLKVCVCVCVCVCAHAHNGVNLKLGREVMRPALLTYFPSMVGTSQM
jgi:hypothetical protein